MPLGCCNDEVLVAVKVLFDATLDNAGVAAAIDDIEERVRAVVPTARPMYVEAALEEPPVS